MSDIYSMKCDEVKEMFEDYCTGEIDSKTYQAIKAHIQSCEACRSEYEATKEIITSLSKIPPPAVSEDFINRTLLMMKKAYRKPQLAYLPQREPARLPYFIYIAVPIVFAALFILFISGSPQGLIEFAKTGNYDHTVFQFEALENIQSIDILQVLAVENIIDLAVNIANLPPYYFVIFALMFSGLFILLGRQKLSLFR